MGVLACDRMGCENIMCDKYSNEFGYICHMCFSELVETHPTSHYDVMGFMGTPKQHGFFNDMIDLDTIFEER